MAQEPKGSSPHSQHPATGPCPQLVESNPYLPSQSPQDKTIQNYILSFPIKVWNFYAQM
jgi:hypothetical protein